MLRYLTKTPRKSYPAPAPGLPNPNDEPSTKQAEECAAVNKVIEQVPTKSPRRGSYKIVSEEVRLEIARYAILNGPTRTSRYFSSKLGHEVSESTVRSMRDKYRAEMSAAPSTSFGDGTMP